MRPMRQERAHLIYRLRVFDAKTGRLMGHMTDITPEGMMLIGEKAVKPKQELSMRMDLPRNVMKSGHLRFEVVSKWCRKDASGDFYAMGFQIESISPEGLAVVRTLIKDFFREELEGDPVTELNPAL